MDIVDEEGNILFFSKNLESIFSSVALGRKCWDIYCDNESQPISVLTCTPRSGCSNRSTASTLQHGFVFDFCYFIN